MTTITLSEDTMVALTNLGITVKENKEALEGVKDFEGYCTIWEALEPGMAALQTLIAQFNL